MPRISVIIVTHNSERTIGACLDAIDSSRLPDGAHEVVVVDNCSSDRTVETVRARNMLGTFLASEQNVGFARAANRGAAVSAGDFLLFLNPDAVLDAGTLAGLLARIDLHATMRLAGCRLVDDRGVATPSAWLLPSLLTTTAESLLPSSWSSALLRSELAGPRSERSVSGACLLIDRALFDRLGGFDERFFLYFEDTDLCARASDAGALPWYFPELRVFHAGRESYRDDPGRFVTEFHRSKLLYLRIHLSPVAAASAGVVVLFGLRMRRRAYLLIGTLFRSRLFLDLGRSHADAVANLVAEMC